MNQQKISTKALVVSSIVAGVIFYALLYVASKWFPIWTGRTLANEWILVFISAIPLLVVLAFMLAGNIAKAKIGGIEFEFEQQIPETLLDSFQLDQNISFAYLMKGRQRELDQVISQIADSVKHPTHLVVPFGGRFSRINFRIMRQYIYKIADVAPIKYVVFTSENSRYLGHMTIEYFRAKYPRYGIELTLEDLMNEDVQSADLPPIFNRNINERSIDEYLVRLIQKQWNANEKNSDNQSGSPFDVYESDLGKLGVSTQKVYVSSSPKYVYWLLLENKLDGIPVTDANEKFIGIVTLDRISQAVVKELLNNSKKSETKK